MKIKASFTTLLIASTSLVHSQSITFTAEIGEIIISPDIALNQSNSASNNIGAFGFFVAAGDFDSFISNEVWTAEDGLDLSEGGLENILGYLGGLSSFGNAQALALVPESAPDFFGILNGQIDAGGPGFHPVMLIHDSPLGLEGLGIGTNLGLVTSSTTTDEFSDIVVGFNTTESWDTTLLGQSGSLTLATVVPEPSSFAALAGVVTLGLVMMRRRRA